VYVSHSRTFCQNLRPTDLHTLKPPLQAEDGGGFDRFDRVDRVGWFDRFPRFLRIPGWVY